MRLQFAPQLVYLQIQVFPQYSQLLHPGSCRTLSIAQLGSLGLIPKVPDCFDLQAQLFLLILEIALHPITLRLGLKTTACRDWRKRAWTQSDKC